MTITYYLDFGYAGTERMPIRVNIPDDELEECESREEKINLINDMVREDFETKVSTYWDESQLK